MYLFAIILGIIGFLLSSNITLGLQLADALGWAYYVYLLAAIITTVLAGIIFLIVSFGSTILAMNEFKNRLITIFTGITGNVIGVILFFIIILKSYIMLWVTDWLIDDLRSSALIYSINDINNNQLVAFMILFLLSFVGKSNIKINNKS